MAGKPPSDVLAAFGADGPPSRIEGGQGGTWVAAGSVFKPLDVSEEELCFQVAAGSVFKPLDVSEEELCFQAELFSSLAQDGFRVAAPRRSRLGELVVSGWTCFELLPGRHEQGRWADIIDVGQRFHAAIREIPEPGFIGRRRHAWSVADRIAFGELDPGQIPPVRHLFRLLDLYRCVRQPAQLIHGDLTGNVLFSPKLPPAIIDFSPYFRPEPFASAVVVADALVFEGADERLLTAVSGVPDLPQYLLRALVYRLVTDRLARPDTPDPAAADDPYLPAVELAVRLVEAGS